MSDIQLHLDRHYRLTFSSIPLQINLTMDTRTVDQHTAYKGSILPYEGIDAFTERLSVNRSALESGDRRTPQYTAFLNVSPEEFEQKIAPKTTSASAFARFRYNTETRDLITKVPGEGHGLSRCWYSLSSWKWAFLWGILHVCHRLWLGWAHG